MDLLGLLNPVIIIAHRFVWAALRGRKFNAWQVSQWGSSFNGFTVGAEQLDRPDQSIQAPVRVCNTQNQIKQHASSRNIFPLEITGNVWMTQIHISSRDWNNPGLNNLFEGTDGIHLSANQIPACQIKKYNFSVQYQMISEQNVNIMKIVTVMNLVATHSNCTSPMDYISHHALHSHIPVHHYTNHTAVTIHSLVLIVSPHLHLIHSHTFKQHSHMHSLRSLVLPWLTFPSGFPSVSIRVLPGLLTPSPDRLLPASLTPPAFW